LYLFYLLGWFFLLIYFSSGIYIFVRHFSLWNRQVGRRLRFFISLAKMIFCLLLNLISSRLYFVLFWILISKIAFETTISSSLFRSTSFFALSQCCCQLNIPTQWNLTAFFLNPLFLCERATKVNTFFIMTKFFKKNNRSILRLSLILRLCLCLCLCLSLRLRLRLLSQSGCKSSDFFLFCQMLLWKKNTFIWKNS
jgi:hypothetical protein